SLQQVSLTDLMYRKSPLTTYMKAEYLALQQESGVGCTYEEYEALAFASTAFEYTSFNEKKTNLVVNTVVNGAVLAIGAALPWKIAMGLGLVSGSVNSYESISGNTIGGRKLSGKERILRGVFGTLDLALAGYSGVKGFKNRGSKVPEVPEKAGGADVTKPNVGVVQSRVNLAENPTRFSPSKNAGMKHVRDRHYNPSKNAGQFTIPESDLKNILQSKQVVNTPVNQIESGGFERVIDIGKNVGTVKPSLGGQTTTWIKVITDKAGNIITTYPVPKP
ncbi:hypothetical protein ACWOFR_12055, partial [Carnobacterium gallinarum]